MEADVAAYHVIVESEVCLVSPNRCGDPVPPCLFGPGERVCHECHLNRDRYPVQPPRAPLAPGSALDEQAQPAPGSAPHGGR